MDVVDEEVAVHADVFLLAPRLVGDGVMRAEVEDGGLNVGSLEGGANLVTSPALHDDAERATHAGDDVFLPLGLFGSASVGRLSGVASMELSVWRMTLRLRF